MTDRSAEIGAASGPSRWRRYTCTIASWLGLLDNVGVTEYAPLATLPGPATSDRVDDPGDAAAHVSAATVTSAVDRPARERACRLLVVDDDAALRAAVHRTADRLGFECVATSADAEFADAAAWLRPDVVLVDLRLGVRSGIDALAAAKHLSRSTRVIVTSGAEDRLIDAAAKTVASMGFTSCESLPKPFTASALAKVLGPPSRPLVRDAHPTDGSTAATDDPSASTSSSAPTSSAASTAASIDASAPDLPTRMSPRSVTRALEAGAIVPYFQPKVACADGSVVGVEALARLVLPDGSVVGPDAFVATAERTGQVTHLSLSMLCQTISFLRQVDCDTLSGAVNFSARSLDRSTALVEKVLGMCEAAGLPPEHITVELTETAFARDPASVLRFVTQCRLAGLGVSLDDFGVGFSSMAMLAELPVSELKIDRSFVLSRDKRASAAIIEASIGIADALGITSTAEGVEDESTLDYLRAAGCDVVQGFLHAPPMPADVASDWLTAHRLTPSTAGQAS